ncbi:ketoacyl-synt-domain-containing protein [Lophiostoma macrostomum CBS 122681]|uniref:Ketoacyl-synt-domain-containing protein n=1 Tax=Lophiostoma macrostomum CBS 122681 TaxID=1314788 RepID=A0A6A6T2S0_9PLEO|nr:ketoacyl-synt-domain-containing protein [Lophiostoma macrostomum CBS 122681]
MDFSFAVFGPQGAAPSISYLHAIRTYILNQPILKCIHEELATIHDIWNVVTEKNGDVAALPQAKEYIGYFERWIIDGDPASIASIASSIVALPRLFIIHVVQYFQFLEDNAISHADFTDRVRKSGGGFQGYCGGMPAAVALASAQDDQSLGRNIMTAIRLAFAIGLYTELGDDSRAPGLAIMVVRVEREAQAEQLVEMFPRTYISAFTDPRNISVVGPTEQLEALMKHATENGFMVQPLEIRGKVHNPENRALADELSALCAESDLLRFPTSERLQCPVRSNRDGAVIPSGRSLSDDVLYTILCSRSEWYKVLQGVAKDLKGTGKASHNILSLGIGDFIPLMPFNKLGLRMTKIEWSGPSATKATEKGSSYTYLDDAIAIVGASCRLPGANNLDELWDLLSTKQDRHEVVKTDRVNIANSYRALQSGNFAKNRKWYGNFIEGVDRFDKAFFGTNAREMANMDPQQRMLLELAYEAMECYGYTKSHVRSQGDNVGCFIGASFTEYLENAYSHKPTAYTAPGTIRAFLCGRISYHFGWTGPSEVIDTACSASLVAVNRAVSAIRNGECPVALAGGVNIISGVHNYLDLARAGFLSATGQCKPWDKDADGYCRSDGVGLVVLKSLKQAQADGDHIMAVIAGAATNQGGLSSSITNPDPVQQARLYKNVLNQAAMQPDQVTYVEAHGTGTQAGDKLETTSLREVFGSPDRSSLLHIGSIKGNIGHCETAAGVAGLLKVVVMLEHQAIPPQASHKEWNPKIPTLSQDRMALPTTLKEWRADFRAALVNSFGAAGSNATVLCCEPPVRPVGPKESDSKYPVVLRAQSVSSLNTYRSSLGNYLSKALRARKPVHVDAVAYTLSERRQHHKYATFLEANSIEELAHKLLGKEELPIVEPEKKPVILMFGGQSKQTIGLSRVLYEQFGNFRQHLDHCDLYLQKIGYPPIVPAIFQKDRNLDNIVVLQTGHVAAQYAAASTWIESGLQIDAVIGHSLGELSALAISGRLSIHDCLRLVAERASLMQERWGSEKGAMLAVFAGQSDVERMIAHLEDSSGGKSRLEIACYNSDSSHVVSGDCASLAELENHIDQQGGKVRYTRVDTSHGFHSRLVEPILHDIAQVSASLDWKTGTIPIELCVADDGVDEAAPYSPSRHAREPVFFTDAVRRLEKRLGGEGCIWLEAGFNTPIMTMAKRAVSQQPHQKHHTFIGMVAKDGEMPGDLISRSVCKLWEFAQPVTHWSFLSSAGSLPNQVWLPPYAFDHTSAWLDNIDRASELQNQHLHSIQDNVVSNQKPRLVSPLPDTRTDERRFRVAVEGERFRTIVAGHAVRGRPLCPASMYLECVTMALQLLVGEDDLHRTSLEFETLDIQAPLGLATHQQVEIILRNLQPQSGHRHYQVDFAVVSRSMEGSPDETTLHAKGRIVNSTETAGSSKLSVLARLTERNANGLQAREGSDVEHMRAGRVYKLFSRVVDYGKVLQGITSMTMANDEAVATISMSAHSRPGPEESSVLNVCDSIALDSFIQVVGLSMNTGDGVGQGEVMICNGIDSSLIAGDFDFQTCSSYRVYTSYRRTNPRAVIGDVFAWSQDGSPVAAFIGCRFVKLDITRLERLLDPASSRLNHGTPAQSRTQVSESSSNGLQSDLDVTTAATTPCVATPPASTRAQDVRQLLETYTGIAADLMLLDTIIGDMGLDSLASTELASELQPADGSPIKGEELLLLTVTQLEERLNGAPMKSTHDAYAVQHRSSRPAPALSLRDNIPSTQYLQSVQPLSEKPASKIDPTFASNKVTELLVETTGVSPSSIDYQSSLQDLGVDSLALTEILSALADICAPGSNMESMTGDSKVADLMRVAGALAQPFIA